MIEYLTIFVFKGIGFTAIKYCKKLVLILTRNRLDFANNKVKLPPTVQNHPQSLAKDKGVGSLGNVLWKFSQMIIVTKNAKLRVLSKVDRRIQITPNQNRTLMVKEKRNDNI